MLRIYLKLYRTVALKKIETKQILEFSFTFELPVDRPIAYFQTNSQKAREIAFL